MSWSAFLCLLLAVSVLQTTCATAWSIKTNSLRSGRLDSDAVELMRDAVQRRRGQQPPQYLIGQHSTVTGLVYELSLDGYVIGLTIMDQQLFVLLDWSESLLVYDTSRPDHALVRNISLPKKQFVRNEMAACSSQQSVFIPDRDTHRIYRVDGDDHVTSWPLPHRPVGVSIDSSSCTVTVTYPEHNSIQEFSGTGIAGSPIAFDLREPWAAVRLSNGRYVVSHGWAMGEGDSGVSLVDGSGHVLQSDSGYTESGSSPIPYPGAFLVSEAGFVLVTDPENARVVLLDPTLRYIRDLLSRDDGLDRPISISLDEGRGLLYVGEYNPRANVKVFALQ